MNFLGFAQLILTLVSSLLASFGKKNLADAGMIVKRLAVASLKAAAEVDNAGVDWSNPQEVSSYVATLPDYEPIP